MTEISTEAIGFQIRALRVPSFKVSDENRVKSDTQVGFNLELEHLADSDQNEHVVRVVVKLGPSGDEPYIAELILECRYLLTGYREWLLSQPEEHRMLGSMPSGLALTLNSISISTARGVLFERLKGTSLQNIVLPVINPSDFEVAH